MTISPADEFYGGIINGFGEYNSTQFKTAIGESWNRKSDSQRYTIAKESGLSDNDARAIHRKSFESINSFLREKLERYELFESFKNTKMTDVNSDFKKGVKNRADVFDPNSDRKDGKRSSIDSIGTADDDDNYSKLIGYNPSPNAGLGSKKIDISTESSDNI